MWLYRTLVEVRCRCDNIVSGNCGETLLKNLQRIQNGAARIITGYEFDALPEPLLHKISCGLFPSYLQEMSHRTQSSR